MSTADLDPKAKNIFLKAIEKQVPVPPTYGLRSFFRRRIRPHDPHGFDEDAHHGHSRRGHHAEQFYIHKYHCVDDRDDYEFYRYYLLRCRVLRLSFS